MPTSNFLLTRDELISLAYEDIKVLAEGEVLSASLQATGIKKLNMIIREYDVAGKHLWAISATPNTVPLVANTFFYTTAMGLSSTTLSIVAANYHDAAGMDTPMKILTTDQYSAVSHKRETGDPTSLYFPENVTVSSKVLYIFPMLSSVNTQSVITGSDTAAWRCIQSHTSDSTTYPITGSNHLLYWELGGSGPVAWATNTQYLAPQSVKIWQKRPLYDFDAATDNPDMPQAFSHWLQQELAIRLSAGHNVPLDKLQMMRSLRNESAERIFRNVQPNTTEIHDKVQYF